METFPSPPRPKRVIQLAGTTALFTPPAPTNTTPQSSADVIPPGSGEDARDSASLCLPNSQMSPSVELLAPKQEPVDLDLVKKEPGPPADLAIQGALVERSLETVLSLPQVVNEVAEQTRDQTSQADSERQVLLNAQEKLKLAEVMLEETVSETASVNRRCYLAEEDAAKYKCTIAQLEQGLETLVQDCIVLQNDIHTKTMEMKENRTVYQKYMEKMQAHQAAVEEVENTLEVHGQLHKQKQMVRELEEAKGKVQADSSKMNDILSGKYQERTMKNIQDIKNVQQDIEGKVVEMKEQLEKETEKQAQVKQEADVLQKRNSAQLTRLRRQLKEIQGRNRLWNDQAAHLEKTISGIKAQLQEISPVD